MSNENKHGIYVTASSTNTKITSNTGIDFKVIFDEPIKIPKLSKLKMCNVFITYQINFNSTDPGICIFCPELSSISSVQGATGQSRSGLIYMMPGKLHSRSVDPNLATGNQNVITTTQRSIYDTYDYPAVHVNNQNEMVISTLTFKLQKISGVAITTGTIANTNFSFYIGNDI